MYAAPQSTQPSAREIGLGLIEKLQLINAAKPRVNTVWHKALTVAWLALDIDADYSLIMCLGGLSKAQRWSCHVC
jgi:hypothetical protein